MSKTTFSTGGFDKVKALGNLAGTVAPRKKDDWVSRLLVSRRGSTKSKVTPGLISLCPPTSLYYYLSVGHSHQHLEFEFTFLTKIRFTNISSLILKLQFATLKNICFALQLSSAPSPHHFSSCKKGNSIPTK